MSDQDREHATLEVDGHPMEVISLSGKEAISELFRYEVVCPTEAGRDPRELLGTPARITLFDGMGHERSITGVIAEGEERAFDDGSAQTTLVVRPAAWTLTLGRSCRVFQDLTVPEIVAQVIAGAACFGRGIAVQWELAGSYAPHVYCAEYREDDWTFVRRLLEEEGIYAFFDHEGAESTLVFADDSSRAPEIAGGARIEVAHESGMNRAVETILELGPEVRVGPSKFTVGSFNPAKPRLAVKGQAGGGDLEIYEAEGGAPDTPDACARLARFMSQAAAARATTARGTSTSVRLVPGMIVEVDGHPMSRLDGRYLIVESSCEVTQRRRGAAGASKEQRPYLCRFRLVPAALSYRLPRVTPRGKQPGLQLGVVVGPGGAEVHPDVSGRVRVQHHWDREGARDESAGKWMRVAQRGTADSMLLPRMGWNVATFNEEGEIDAPSVLSRLQDAEHPPTYALPANKTRVVWKTATTPGGGSFNEIYFEDKAGSEEMFINASKDHKILVQNDRDERVSRDVTRKIGHDHTLHVEGDYSDTIKRDQTLAIGNDERVEVHGSAKKTVAEDETNTIAGKRSLTVGATHTDQIKETRNLVVGAAQIDTTLGLISSTATITNILVGGAVIRASAGRITESNGYIGVQTIGCAKLEICPKNRVLTVKKAHIETVGGALTMTAGGAYKDHAEMASTWTVGVATEAKAPSIVIEAKDQIVLKVGASSLTITADEITIAGPHFDLPASAKVVTNTPQESHN